MFKVNEGGFKLSPQLYAVALSSLTRREYPATETGLILYRYEICAIWFKRRKGIDTANIGYLWDITKDRYEEHNPPDSISFLTDTLTDGRFGAHCYTRWDGERAWSDPSRAHYQTEDNLEFLKVMLDSYPMIPPGFDGWWRF